MALGRSGQHMPAEHDPLDGPWLKCLLRPVQLDGPNLSTPTSARPVARAEFVHLQFGPSNWTCRIGPAPVRPVQLDGPNLSSPSSARPIRRAELVHPHFGPSNWTGRVGPAPLRAFQLDGPSWSRLQPHFGPSSWTGRTGPAPIRPVQLDWPNWSSVTDIKEQLLKALKLRIQLESS